ncbi:P-loop containing nucleoside triphosphate hydrolase protein [Mucor lusitanicus]|uniref:Ras-related protein Rab n=2 Tax=Mucor circinelloides f. lusitanicus TaxID=29924 RepID=A0A168KRW0_MUCCL|nr:P-loop containing nucleoside triphosphate hydrolase protein [Mucor lusitanicus]OAD02696.1 hypothetical protein MUCCIDRAFT_195374 [Mucor lusitanicus CBS 277.49]
MGLKEYQYKILVVGDLGTGKTSILKRYIHNTFTSNYKSTIGVDFALKIIQIDPNTIVSLQMWDIAGQERFGSMTQAYYRGAIGAFIVYDATRPLTFQNVSRWKNDIDTKVELPLAWGGGSIPVVLLANKIDQHPNTRSPKEMEEFCRENSFAQWFETSAKENTNIDQAAEYLISHIVQLEMSKQSDSEYEVDYSSSDSGKVSLHDEDRITVIKPSCC